MSWDFVSLGCFVGFGFIVFCFFVFFFFLVSLCVLRVYFKMKQ